MTQEQKGEGDSKATLPWQHSLRDAGESKPQQSYVEEFPVPRGWRELGPTPIGKGAALLPNDRRGSLLEK